MEINISPAAKVELETALAARAQQVAEEITGLNAKAAQDAGVQTAAGRKLAQERLRPSRMEKVCISTGISTVGDVFKVRAPNGEHDCWGEGISRDLAMLDFDYKWEKPARAVTGEFFVVQFVPTNRLMAVPPDYRIADNGFWRFIPIMDQPVPAKIQDCGCTVRWLSEPDEKKARWRRLSKCFGDEAKCSFKHPHSAIFVSRSDDVNAALQEEAHLELLSAAGDIPGAPVPTRIGGLGVCENLDGQCGAASCNCDEIRKKFPNTLRLI